MQAIYAHPLVAELLAHSVPHQAAPEKSPESESALDDNLETKFDPSIADLGNKNLGDEVSKSKVSSDNFFRAAERGHLLVAPCPT